MIDFCWRVLGFQPARYLGLLLWIGRHKLVTGFLLTVELEQGEVVHWIRFLLCIKIYII